MSKLPRVTPRAMIAALRRAGFVVDRVKGSHHFLEHKSDPRRRTVVAVHTGDLPEGTLRDILKQAGITRDEFLKLL
jgi:predicted RNA binding protein YcfA (HicA-like mRNA interferase family)